MVSDFYCNDKSIEHLGTSSSQCIFCILTSSHLHNAHALYESLTFFSDLDELNFDFYIFLLGSKSLELEAKPNQIKYIYIDKIFDEDFLRELADKYTPSEFCWVLKPFISEWLFKWYQLLFYFDSDICFFNSIELVHHEMTDTDILLTPHYLHPFGCTTSFGVRSLSLLRGGVFNAGFIGLRNSEQSLLFLKWWQVHVTKHGRNDPDNGMCGDQRWLDLVPVLFDKAKICRHPGMNVGYWNIHERQIVKNLYSFEVSGKPLLFMHFSAFNENNHLTFSSHLPLFEADSVLSDILENYSASLIKHKIECKSNISKYIYHRWWHKHVGLYRWFLSFFRNPRSCS